MQIHNAIRSLKEACALKHLALSTEKAYIHWLLRYAAFLKEQKPNPPNTTEQKIEDFLTSLALDGVSASTQNQAFNGLLFFYKDLDLKKRRLFLHQAKGSKGRVVHFPECLASSLEQQLAVAKVVAFVRDLQVVLGHSHLETTMLYLHAEAGRVVSPLKDFVTLSTPPPVPTRGVPERTLRYART